MIKFIYSLLIFLFLTTTTSIAQKKYQLQTIIIDPGHGYPDVGAKGARSYESDVNLNIGTVLAEKIKKTFPNIKVILTRSDKNLPNNIGTSAEANRYRADMANQNKGDLFISIHADAKANSYIKTKIGTKTIKTFIKRKGKKIPQTKVVNIYKRQLLPHTEQGSSIYILAAHKNKDKDEIIKENLDVLIDAEDTSQQQSFNSPALMAMAALWEKKFFKKSLLLASLVSEELLRKKRISLGVKQRQKGIWVLQATSMPSILVETGYISTHTEEEFLNSKDGVNLLTEAIVNALTHYQRLVENNQYTIPKELIAPPLLTSVLTNNDDEDDSNNTYVKPEERKDKIYQTFTVKTNQIKMLISNNNTNDVSLYSIFDKEVFLDKKTISHNKPQELNLEFDDADEIDMTFQADSLINRGIGSIKVRVYDDNKLLPETHVLVTNQENGTIVIKRK